MNEQSLDPAPVDPVEPLTVLPVQEEIPEVLRVAKERPPVHLGFWVTFFITGGGLVALLFVGGETALIAASGLQAQVFVLLVLLAYAGMTRSWLRPLAFVYWTFLLGGFGLAMIGLAALAVQETSRATDTPQPWDAAPIAWSALGVLLSLLLGVTCFAPAVRRLAARFMPLDPESFVHATALATVVGLAAVCFVPLLTLGQPPILLLPELMNGAASKGEEQRSELYELAWLVLVSVMAVGYPLARTMAESGQRLGLVGPRMRHAVFALVAGLLLVPAMWGVDEGVTWLWRRLGWPTTDSTAMSELFKAFLNPVGAIVIAVTAGIGEELAVRGALQPRLGILLSNLFFTALHALQYNFDGLLSVFLVGLVFGVIRKRTNTTTSAMVHGTYDFLLVMLMYLEVPGFR
jgi:membrane protease YdiL (CAAX protease family)